MWTLCVPITLFLASTLRDINCINIQSRMVNTHQNGYESFRTFTISKHSTITFRASVDEFISVTEQSNVWRRYLISTIFL